MYNLINKAATLCGQNLSQHWIWITFLGRALCKQSSAVDQIIDYSFFIKLYLIASGKGDINEFICRQIKVFMTPTHFY